MATQIKTWQIIDGKLEDVESSMIDEGKKEEYDLETWIASNPAIIGPDLAIIGRQVSTKSGPLDLLAIDLAGNMVIIELKRDRLPREALAQAIDYASDVAEWNIDRIGETCAKYTSQSLDDLMNERFPFKKSFHIIFCRNVMIYFDQNTREKLVEKLYDFTTPGGYLFIGNAETLGRNQTRYTYIAPSIYQRME